MKNELTRGARRVDAIGERVELSRILRRNLRILCENMACTSIVGLGLSVTMETYDLRQLAREILAYALQAVDAKAAVYRAVSVKDRKMRIFDSTFDLSSSRPIYAVALGKAAGPMAAAIDAILGDQLTAGVASIAPPAQPISRRWRIFLGGHPLPNRESLEAARAALTLLREADERRALVLFLVSGGGSAMMEWPRDELISLEDLRTANLVLTTCGATIAEINAVRRAFSAIKGGRLSDAAPHTDQVTLIISDTNSGDEMNVASGPTIPQPQTDELELWTIITKYELGTRLPASIIHAIRKAIAQREVQDTGSRALRRHYVLLNNSDAVQAAAVKARACGFSTQIASDIVEQRIEEGCAELVRRLCERRRDHYRVCLISGGEFGCPKRGDGQGGRNAETALRCALEFEAQGLSRPAEASPHVLALSMGTDGIDGNSPAAGAISDDTTLARARIAGLDARDFLERSDSYTFFRLLGDAIITGPTGTNVRDLRVLLSV